MLHHFYAEPLREEDPEVFLTPEDAKHARTVLRLQAGDPVELFCGENRWLARIRRIDPKEVTVVREELLSSTEPGLTVTLFQGLPKGDKMDWVVQKAVEAGACRIVPLKMNRCIVQTDAAGGRKKAERWQRIAREAGKQCGRCRMPRVLEPMSIAEALPLMRETEALIVPWEDAVSYGPRAYAADHPAVRSLSIVIGPEGGIEEEEIDLLKEAGAVTLTLGKRILRTETAGLVTISALMALSGVME